MEFHMNRRQAWAFFPQCAAHYQSHQPRKVRAFKRLFREKGARVGKDNVNIFRLLRTNPFADVASIFLMVDFECDCSMSPLLVRLYNAIKKNPNLRLVAKILITNYCYNFKPVKALEFVDAPMQCRARLLDRRMSLRAELLSEAKIDISGLTIAAPELHELDNIIIVDIKKLVILETDPFYSLLNDDILSGQFTSELFALCTSKSVEEIVLEFVQKEQCQNDSCDRSCRSMCYYTNTTNGCFVFNVNPVFAIVLNCTNFTNTKLPQREPSQHDLQRVCSTLRTNRIPALIVDDCSAEIVKLIVWCVSQLRLHLLKYLYIIVMSHGDENDIIYTKTGAYNLNADIIRPLLANPSLKDVVVLLFVQACRGTYNPFLAIDYLEPQPTESLSWLKPNLVRVFSTPRGCVSFLHQTGSYFIKELCSFLAHRVTISVDQLVELLDESLLDKLSDYYPDFGRIVDCDYEPSAQLTIRNKLANFTPLVGIFQSFLDLLTRRGMSPGSMSLNCRTRSCYVGFLQTIASLALRDCLTISLRIRRNNVITAAIRNTRRWYRCHFVAPIATYKALLIAISRSTGFVQHVKYLYTNSTLVARFTTQQKVLNW